MNCKPFSLCYPSPFVNPPKFSDLDYITYLLAAPKDATSTEMARTFSEAGRDLSHDAINRLLQRASSDTETLWQEAKPHVRPSEGNLVLDDSTADKQYARNIELVTRHWSGKHHAVVEGINLLTLLWTDGEAKIPCDFRLYDAPFGGKTKNESFRDMLEKAKERGFTPKYVIFDTWYASLDNLKRIRGYGWFWFSRLAHNRHVNPDAQGNVHVSEIEIPADGRKVHLKGYGWIKVFKTKDSDGKPAFWATNDLSMSEPTRKDLAAQGWQIEVYHRGLKQFCLVERCQVRHAHGQRVHFLFSLRAFLRLEVYRLKEGVSWYEAKMRVVRKAVAEYLQKPFMASVFGDPTSA